MKVQLQTNFTANYGSRANTAQKAGVSKVNFGTRAMDEFLAVEGNEAKKLARIEQQQAASEFTKKVEETIAQLRLDQPIAKVSGATLTSGTLLGDLYEETRLKDLVFSSTNSSDSPYLDRFKQREVRINIHDYVDQTLINRLRIFESRHNPSGYDNSYICLTDLGSAVLKKLFKTAKAAK